MMSKLKRKQKKRKQNYTRKNRIICYYKIPV
jgi:hypothetical protein